MGTRGPDPFTFGDYRRVFAARAISSAGTYVQIVGGSWYAYMVTGNASASGLLAALALGPTMAGGPVGGYLADRYDPRRLAMLLSFLQGVPPALLAVAAGLGELSTGLLFSLVLAGAVSSGLNSPVMAIVMQSVVPKDVVHAAVTRTSLVWNVSRLLGAVGGGLVVHWLGLAVAFGINAASYAVVVAALSRVRLLNGPGQAVSPESPPTKLSEAFGTRIVKIAALAMVAFFLLVAPVEHLMPVVAMEHSLTAAAVGILVGALAVGALVGNPIVARYGSADARRGILALGLILAAAGMAVLAATPHHGIAVDVGGVLLIGLGWELIFVGGQSTVAVDVPREVRGRVMGLFFLVVSGCTALGALALGALIDHHGLTRTFAASIVVVLPVAVALLFAGTPTGAPSETDSAMEATQTE